MLRLTTKRFLRVCIAASWLAAGLAVGCKPEAELERDAAQRAAEKTATAVAPPVPDQKAGVGVGVKGRSLEGGSEYNPATLVSGPAAAYFRTKEKIVFDIQLPQAVNLFVAEKGRHPKSHEEYMQVIIQSNRINLPKIPEGMVYRYHPDTQELWMESEKKSGEQETSTPDGAAGDE